MSETTQNMTVSYGKAPGTVYSFDLGALPTASLIALASSGLAHKMGNEVASQVSTEKAKRKEAGSAELTEAEIDTMLAELREEMAGKILAGTIGTSTRGPRGTALDTIVRQKAKAEMVAVLAKHGITFPEGKYPKTHAQAGEARVIVMDGKAVTGSELVDRYLTKHSERLTALAKREMAAVEKAAEAATKSTEGQLTSAMFD